MSETLNTNTEQNKSPAFPESREDLEAMHQETLELVARKLGTAAASEYANFSPLVNYDTRNHATDSNANDFGPTSSLENVVAMQHNPNSVHTAERFVSPNTYAASLPLEAQAMAPYTKVTDLAAYRRSRHSQTQTGHYRPAPGSLPTRPSAQPVPLRPSSPAPGGRRNRFSRFVRSRFSRQKAA